MYKNAKYYVIGISCSLLLLLYCIISFSPQKNESTIVVAKEPNKSILKEGTYFIGDITIKEGAENLRPKDASTIRKILKAPNSVVWIANEQDFITNKEKSLRENGYVASIQVTKKKEGRITLVVNLTATPIYLRHIALQGVTNKEKKKLRKLFTIKKGNTILENHVKKTQKQIEHYFRKKGYADIQVVSHTSPKKLAKGILCFRIQRGIQYYLYHCNYKGIEKSATKKLRKQSRLRPTKGELNNYWLEAYRFLFGPEVFVEQKIKQHEQFFLAYYKSKGFLDATISYTYKKKGDKVLLTFDIDQGEQYKISKVDIQGLENDYSLDKAKKILAIKEGQPFFESLLYQKVYGKIPKHDLFEFYEKREKWLWLEDIQTKKLPNHEVEVYLSFSTCPLPNIADVVIDTDLNKDLVRNILHTHDLKKGFQLKKSNLTACTYELQSLSFVKSDSLMLIPISTAQGEVVIKAQVLSRGELEFYFGSADGESDEPAVGFGIKCNNIDFMQLFQFKLRRTGSGQNINLSYSTNQWPTSTNMGAINFSIENPYFFINEIPFTLYGKASCKPYLTDPTKSTGELIGGIGHKFHTGLARHHIGANLKYLYQKMQTQSPESISTNLYWNIDSTNDNFFPTEGFKVNLLTTCSGKKESWSSLPSFNYWNSSMNASYFIPLKKNKRVCKLNVQVGRGTYKENSKLGYFSLGRFAKEDDTYLDYHPVLIRSQDNSKTPSFGVAEVDFRKYKGENVYWFTFLNGGVGINSLAESPKYVATGGCGVALLTPFGPIELITGYDIKNNNSFIKLGAKMEC